MKLRAEFVDFSKLYDNFVGDMVGFKRAETNSFYSVERCGKPNGVNDGFSAVRAVCGKIDSDKHDFFKSVCFER